MGERAGNVALESTVAAINDFIPNVKLNIKENSLYKLANWFQHLQVIEFLQINQLLDQMCLHKQQVFMPTETIKKPIL